MKRLTEEQKKNRKEFEEIAKRLDKEAGRDKIRFNNVGDSFFSYRSFVILGKTDISEGGWYNGRKWMTAKYLKNCVNRWVVRSYETGKEQPDYDTENEWIPHQCGGCRWFAALDSDYGFCCNLKSSNEGRITFEHGGCKEHSDYDKPVKKESIC